MGFLLTTPYAMVYFDALLATGAPTFISHCNKRESKAETSHRKFDLVALVLTANSRFPEKCII